MYDAMESLEPPIKYGIVRVSQIIFGMKESHWEVMMMMLVLCDMCIINITTYYEKK